MVTALVHGRVLRAGALRDGEAVLLDGERIAAIVPLAEVPADAARHDLQGAMLLPGFIDTQVNGGGGVLFNDSTSVEGIAAIGAAHRRFGTTGFLPTLISDDLEVIRHAVAAVDAAITEGVPGVLGIHIEGPFLNVERRGIHRADKIRELDEEGLAILTSLKRGRTLVTLAPERTTPATIRRLTDAGVIVAAGHSNATYEQSIAAVEAGTTGITHLFNAMSPLTSRAPGLTGASLERPELICGIIVDGHHVSPTTLKIALRCKPPEQLMLVTDAMPSVGSDSDEFLLQGRHIRVLDGVCRDVDGTIAGSHLDMATALANTMRLLGAPIEAAACMAAHAPAAFLGLADSLGQIAPGYRADLVALDDAFHVTGTWIGGAGIEA
ncbi:N-acetylglucosamine-6-phosphate deacetylase [Sphingomonas naasensis]|uniref:N-acetylglucosamine-6-phosphate deacetylase n=1 Tax=Sphingomonas naasensis TaxID=1344951 RepID=A0A4S1WSE5_9SPHN|nr:N-acetylglucosamine-6-phosphate deacetylase [Sphingomonas naasensis]NIJ19117.1 N-acetylglucosamine-6-phosphate deacetylase [Sphingomonas naasensis]TGX46311.1 N-acetylglucosamine-6-phosphate deacetylase [Sphingomonas naasensis]